tara:strand:+ start:3976 stop:4230 length:255 start_codon:yes stop_codon:yes gene_type:complete
MLYNVLNNKETINKEMHYGTDYKRNFNSINELNMMRAIFYMIIGAALVLGFQEHYAVTEFAKEVLATGATWVLAVTNDSTVVIY